MSTRTISVESAAAAMSSALRGKGELDGREATLNLRMTVKLSSSGEKGTNEAVCSWKRRSVLLLPLEAKKLNHLGRPLDIVNLQGIKLREEGGDGTELLERRSAS